MQRDDQRMKTRGKREDERDVPRWSLKDLAGWSRVRRRRARGRRRGGDADAAGSVRRWEEVPDKGSSGRVSASARDEGASRAEERGGRVRIGWARGRKRTRESGSRRNSQGGGGRARAARTCWTGPAIGRPGSTSAERARPRAASEARSCTALVQGSRTEEERSGWAERRHGSEGRRIRSPYAEADRHRERSCPRGRTKLGPSSPWREERGR